VKSVTQLLSNDFHILYSEVSAERETKEVGLGDVERSYQNLTYLDSICNSIIIEIYSDRIRVSHGFEYRLSFGFIDICNLDKDLPPFFCIIE